MSVIAYCGHKVFGEDMFKGYYWRQWGSESELSYGSLCPQCVPVYRAVPARSWEEAERLLAETPPVDLIDILSGQTGIKPKVENIGGIDFRILKLPQEGE